MLEAQLEVARLIKGAGKVAPGSAEFKEMWAKASQLYVAAGAPEVDATRLAQVQILKGSVEGSGPPAPESGQPQPGPQPSPDDEAAARAKSMPGAAQEEGDQPKPLGMESIPGFDESATGRLTLGGKTQSAVGWYKEGDQVTEWWDMDEPSRIATKKLLWLKGYYGKDLPRLDATVGKDDWDALGEAMATSNGTGTPSWRDALSLQTDAYGRAAEKAKEEADALNESSGSDGSIGGKSPAEIKAERWKEKLEARAARVQARAVRASTAESLRGFAELNGITLTDDYVDKHAAAVAEGRTTLDLLKGNLRKNYVARVYPGFKDQVLAGEDMKDLAMPYVSAANELLEQDTRMDDPVLQRALQTRREDGNPDPPPLWKFREDLRDDPRWASTDNAWDEIGKQAFDFMQVMGVQP